jgi:hypothetical protein
MGSSLGVSTYCSAETTMIFHGGGGMNASRGTSSKIRSRRGSLDWLATAICRA